MSKRNSSFDVVSSVNNLKLVFSDGYLNYSDVTIIVRNHPALVRRVLRTCLAYSSVINGNHAAVACVKREGDLYFRECLSEIVFEYLNSDVDVFFSRSQKRKINRLPHPVLSDFNFY